ncbi:hypothetical protein SDC9_123128 [bioreactor metagenome]|uniref:Uncharacterized protein n=1 Tax=bioreactor metagenome TaxID=1076179 RepID=A0A645CGU4_9ZZZZ
MSFPSYFSNAIKFHNNYYSKNTRYLVNYECKSNLNMSVIAFYIVIRYFLITFNNYKGWGKNE